MAKIGRAGAKGGLGGLAARALGLNFLSTVLAKLSLTGFGLLARLLGPHEYAEVAVAMTALLAILSFNELGVSLAIVRWPEDPAEIVPTITTISIVSSCLLYVGAYYIAPLFADAMGAPQSTSIIRVMSLIIVTNGVASVPAAVLQRNFQQGRQMIVDQVHGWLGTLVSVALAFYGMGAMSLAIGQLAGAATGMILLVIFCPVRMRFGFKWALARKLLSFGMPLAGSSLIVFFVGNVDNFICGRVLGATALGFYVLAWNLASLPVNIFSQPVRSVAPAFFSRMQGDKRAMRSGFASVAGMLGAVTLPVCLGICGAALPLVTFIYGAKWAGAAQALTWLAVLAAVRVLFELIYDYFVVLGKSRVVLKIQLIWLVILVPDLVSGAYYLGIKGIALAGLAVAVGLVLPFYVLELWLVGIPIVMLARRLWLPCVVSAVVGATAWEATRVFPVNIEALALTGFVGTLALAFLGYHLRQPFKELRAVLKSQDEPQGADVAGSVSATGALIMEDLRVTESAPRRFVGATTSNLVATTMPIRISRPTVPIRVAGLGQAGRNRPGLPIYHETVSSFGWDPVPSSQHDARHAHRRKADGAALPRDAGGTAE
jgi:O-antigen/teichoic acid export membrane protein